METSNIITRKEAKQAGHKYYFTGNPCKHGHVDYRLVVNSMCKSCHRYWSSKFQDKNKSKITSRRNQKKDSYKAIEIYGSQCQGCGETNWALLNFHHTGGRNKTQKWENFSSVASKVCNAGTPLDEYQLLCCNCHRLADLRDGTNNIGSRLKQLQEKFCPNS